ncbi:MAG: pilus assembly protein TadG-related protein [Marmoricola sp.]
MRSKLARRRDESGAIAVVFAISALILFVIAGLVVDLGLARDTRRDSQNAADASALAAANVLFPTSGSCTAGAATPPCYTDAINAAQSFAAANYDVSSTEWASCTDPNHYYVPAGSTPCISFTDSSLITTLPSVPSKIRVIIPVRNVKTTFGTLAGISTVPVRSFARASLASTGTLPCGVCVLGTGNHAIGNGDITVSGASVYLNGDLGAGPNGNVITTTAGNTISVQGTASGGCCSPTAITGAPQLPDPLAGAIVFPLAGTSSLSVKTDPCSQGPGKYGAVNLPNSTCTLTAGLYVITGNWDFKNNTLLKGTGVTLYFTCGTAATPTVCNNAAGGALDTKNGNIDISAPTTGALANLAIAFDPTNTSPISLQGNGSAAFTGTIYAPSSTIGFPGNSCATTFNAAIIVGDVYSNGNQACLSVNFAQNQNVKPLPGNAALDQ